MSLVIWVKLDVFHIKQCIFLPNAVYWDVSLIESSDSCIFLCFVAVLGDIYSSSLPFPTYYSLFVGKTHLERVFDLFS